MVQPFLRVKGTFGKPIGVEVKGGKQKYQLSHRTEAMQHAIKGGWNYAMLIYDQPDNLGELAPLAIMRIGKIFLGVAERENGSWKVIRHFYEYLQELKEAEKIDLGLDELVRAIHDCADVQATWETLRKHDQKLYQLVDKIHGAVIPNHEEALRKYLNQLKEILNSLANRSH